jgi:hypothetical protein
MEYEGLKNLLYFAYGSLTKGVCSDSGNVGFPEKVRAYLEGDDSLEKEIIEEIYEELPHAIPELYELAEKKKTEPFSLENVSKYIFEVHNCEVMPACKVMGGKVLSINKKNKKLEVERDGKIFQVNYLSSLESSFKVGGTVYFHHGWAIKRG